MGEQGSAKQVQVRYRYKVTDTCPDRCRKYGQIELGTGTGAQGQITGQRIWILTIFLALVVKTME